MLTALSVARDCGLVANNERVASVHVVAASDGQAAQVCYTDCDKLDVPLVSFNFACGHELK
jgi:hypothetical protein